MAPGSTTKKERNKRKDDYGSSPQDIRFFIFLETRIGDFGFASAYRPGHGGSHYACGSGAKDRKYLDQLDIEPFPMQMTATLTDTIVALSTPAGVGAIALVRLSGPQAVEIVSRVFVSRSPLSDAASHTAHFGTIRDGGRVLDEVVATVFRAPHSYTGQDVVEVACHGSLFIQQQLLELFVRGGARLALGGEFTKRAFLNGKMDLSQAEAVADLIASESYAAHAAAIHQMRGGYSERIARLREELLEFVSLIELELDFSDQDVEFADRSRLETLLGRIDDTVGELSDSFSLGNAIKNGIPVVIAGDPNVGKSTLLNALLGEEKAIVSPIAGTTRDAIEDRITISGVVFRFIDTAGLRSTDDTVERLGIERACRKIGQAEVVIYVMDATAPQSLREARFREFQAQWPGKRFVPVLNKVDQADISLSGDVPGGAVVPISARTGFGLEVLRKRLTDFVDWGQVSDRTIVTNARHYDALVRAGAAIRSVRSGLQQGISGDLLAVDIRDAISCLSEITGDITEDDVLGSIFSKFCIGK